MHSVTGLRPSLWRGCPIRILRAHRSHAAPPERFAGLRVLHRPSAPRHPPRTLSRLSRTSSLLFTCLTWCVTLYDFVLSPPRTRPTSLPLRLSSLLFVLCLSLFFLPSAKLK